jgi:hypothetical protein
MTNPFEDKNGTNIVLINAVANIRSGPTLLKSQPAGPASTSLTPAKPALITSTKIGLT